MNLLTAIAASVCLLVITLVLTMLTDFNVVGIMVLGTAIWAAVDSSKLQLKRYKSGIAYGPVVIFFGCVMIWIIAFPWYLAMRHKIQTGTAVLKDGPPPSLT